MTSNDKAALAILWVFGVLALSAYLVSFIFDHQKPVPSPAEQALRASVQIVQENGDMVGSGVQVAEGKVITNRHVCQAFTGAPYVQFRDGSIVKAAVGWQSETSHDLCLVLVSDARAPWHPVEPCNVDAKVGESVLAVGGPYGIKWTVTRGIVSNPLRRLPSGDYRLHHDAPIGPGSSGGGVFRASSGCLLAVNNSVLQGNNIPLGGMSFAVPMDQLRELNVF